MAKWNDLVLAIPKQPEGRLEDEAAEALLETLLGTQEEQLSLLRQLHRDVRPLQEGPFHAGRSHLEAARKPRRAHGEGVELLEPARGNFTDALGIEQDKARISLIALHLALCWLLLGSAKDAREWTAMAHRSAVEAMQDILSEAARDDGLTRNRYLDRALVFVMFFTSAATLGAGYLFWDKVISKRADRVLRRALARMEPLAEYIDKLGEIRVRLGEPAMQVPRYELTHALDDSHYLTRVTIRKVVNERETLYFNGRETRRVTWNDSERSEVLTRELL